MSFRKTGSADLRLHSGYAPDWLVSRMVKLAEGIFTVVVDEFGVSEVLARLSDPLFFQACSNVLGYDWDSSGATTVTCGVLKTVFNSLNLGLKAAGGKGRRSRETLSEIVEIGDDLRLSTGQIERLQYASRMTAKVDSAAIQAGYQIYHHTIFIAENGEWAVVQQGMNVDSKSARRYHWLSNHVKSFVVEPHEGIVGQLAHKDVLNMTSRDSEGSRRVCVDLAKEGPKHVERLYSSIRGSDQMSLAKWVKRNLGPEYIAHYKIVPKRMEWKALKKAYEIQPKNYEKLLAIKGVGPSTVRGLALISELIYGEPPSWRDPVKYSFCVGGKDGVPFPVDKVVYDEIISILKNAVEQAKVGDKERINAIKRLSNFAGQR
jgi:hypothetical protein